MAMSMVFGLAAGTASAKPSIAKQAKKKCKNKKGKAKQKCVKKTTKKLKAQAKRERNRIKNVPGATIRTTEYGIPRIVADNYKGLGFGYGYALAKENICSMADIYTTQRGERSKYFGPDGDWQLTGNGYTFTNLQADFAHKRIIAEKKIPELLKLKAPQGPKPQVRDVVAGYVKGYNSWLKQTGVNKIQDETCKGKPWVKPITALEVYLRFYELGTLASAGAVVDGTTEASPPVAMASADSAGPADEPTAEDFEGLADKLDPEVGSNAVSLGSEATSTGKGMLFGNPHFPWSGTERFFQAQLTIPGKINVSGASLLGAPVVLIGHTQNLAWSHTVSTSRRFMLYSETLAPGDPTSYMVDGKPVKMESVDVTVDVKQADGSIVPETRTLYSTKHGPVTSKLPGITVGWNNTTAYSLRDPNSDGLRFINHFFDADRSQSVNDMVKSLKRNQGVPWVNTIAADSKGNALYADVSVTPDVTPERFDACKVPGLGDIAWSAAKVALFDGTKPACDPQLQPGAVVKGILSPSQMPIQVRKDYGSNMNDSYWVSNPKAPLEGFAPIIGGDRTTRSLRTRNGLVQIEQQLADGGKFTLSRVAEFITNNRNYSAELLAPALVAYCQNNPTINGVDVSGACAVLANWDKTESVDSSGALLWRTFMNMISRSEENGGVSSANRYVTPFDVNDPVHTPNGLNVTNPNVPKQLADAVTYLASKGIPVDAKYRDYQYVTKNGQKIPIPGGFGGQGVFNVISAVENEDSGIYDSVVHGSSFIIAASLTGAKCPPVKTMLTYSQAATNEKSKHYADQTKLFSEGKWVNDRFCASQQKKSPGLTVKKLNGGAVATKRGW
ncbi:MAG TPA: penicillin acylase family protein [Solirubrobacterales bacterium]|nr:penicillin acylase family protein [Solirubrobacterales bacterium]